VSPLAGVRSFYPSEQDIAVGELPDGAVHLAWRRQGAQVLDLPVEQGAARLEGLPTGTYEVLALDADGGVLGAELATLAAHPGARPVHGFASSFRDEDVASVLGWHEALRSTVVQVYDWMASYTEPLGPASGWRDPSRRPVSFAALRSLAAGLDRLGAVAHAYAPIYAVGHAFAAEHPDLLMYSAHGSPVAFLDQIILADPGNAAWQRHFVKAYGSAADAIGFTGFHVDTYGYPRLAERADGSSIDLRFAYESFLDHLRLARPADLISFNQVNGVPSAARIAADPAFRYCEVWPPNVGWRHLEGLLDRSSGRAGMLDRTGQQGGLRGSVACYPPVWDLDAEGVPRAEGRAAALRTVVCTEAVATMLGASSLIFGDRTGALCDPYYPKHVRLVEHEARTVLEWRRFALRCRDCFLDGEDTSWYEIDDENGAVAVEADVPVRPEPLGGSAFARVVHGPDHVAIGVLDLSGSEHGSWSEPTLPGRLDEVTVRVLLARPDRHSVRVAVLGRGDGRFEPVHAEEVRHRQGRALQFRMPLVGGWSVARVTPT
jgi:dextranase